MKSLHALNVAFVIVMVIIGSLIYSSIQEYNLHALTKEDIINITKEIKQDTNIEQLRAKYINHLQRNFQNHQNVLSIFEYIAYLFAGMVVFMVLTIVIASKIALR